MSLEQARIYLARVVPWVPGTYVNIHWTTTKLRSDGKPYWNGRACTTVDEALQVVRWVMGKPTDFQNIYVCLSAQVDCEVKQYKTSTGSYRNAIRSSRGAAALRSIFLDIDVKPADDRAYPDTATAAAELARFVAETGLPDPTLAVQSGTGGMHVYWTTSRDLAPEEWQGMAFALAEATRRHGLKCDSQCTVDAARVLRVPGTLNWKTSPPSQVVLGEASMQPGDYAPEALQAALAPYTGAVVLPFGGATGVGNRVPGLNDEFTAGIAQALERPVDIASAATSCGFLHEALDTGGQAFNNPLWNTTTLIATFGGREQGRALAHAMAAGHPDYSPESTDDLFDRKLREREERNIGWPKCQTIENMGCSACATCPFRAQGLSPLNFGKAPAAPAPSHAPLAAAFGAQPSPAPTQGSGNVVTPGFPGAPPAQGNDVPTGYFRNAHGAVFKLVPKEDGTTEQRLVLPYALEDGWLQENPWTLHFVTRLGNAKKPTQVSVTFDQLNGRELPKHLGKFGLAVGKAHATLLQEYLVDWTSKLQAMKDAVTTAPFGWDLQDSKINGFIFGSRVWTANGDIPASLADPLVMGQYTPTGEAKHWLDASMYLTAGAIPELNALMAISFGAPLMRFTGEDGVICAAYTTESGAGKSAMQKCAQAVWGHPTHARQGMIDTPKSVMRKVGTLQCLPLFWDEIHSQEAKDKFLPIVFTMTQGREGTRLTKDVQQQTVGSWKTILSAVANDSVLDMVARQTKSTTAGVYRVFEWPVPVAGFRGDKTGPQVARMIGNLENHYGHAGLAYAQFLGAQHARVAKEVAQLQDTLAKRLHTQSDERFWLAGIVCMVMGARYANELKLTRIDVEELLKFLLGTLASLRETRKSQGVDLKSPDALSNVLAQFLGAQRARHTLVTSHMHVGQGRPPANTIKVISDTARLEGIYVHVGFGNKLLRLSNAMFREWCANKGYSPHLVVENVKTIYGAKHVRGVLGSGTAFAGFKEDLLEIDLAGTTVVNLQELAEHAATGGKP